MRFATVASVFASLGVLALAGTAMADGGVHTTDESTINANVPSTQELIYSTAGECRDCWTSGITLRAAGSPTGGGASGSITIPPHVAANAVFAQLFWVVLDGSAPPANTERLNGTLLNRIAIGPVTDDPCWLASSNAYAYRADVLALLQAGGNTLSNFPDVGVLDGAPVTEGATLVIVYDTPAADKEISIFAGNDLVILNGVDLAIPTSSGPGIGAEITFIVGDGQPAADQALWNGVSLGGNDAFVGLDPGPGVGFWDTVEFGVATGGANTASVVSGGDCLNWVGTVFCVKKGGCVVPVEESTWGRIKTLIN